MSHAEPSPPQSPVPRRFPWRRLFQYRLRTLLIVVTLFAGFFAWWTNAARRQRDAVAALTRNQANVGYHCEWFKISPPRFRPTWLVNLLGVDYFDDVVFVILKKNATDADLAYVRHMTGLRLFAASDSRVSGAGLENLQGMTQLQILTLDNTQVTDAGLKHIRRMTELEHLFLGATQVTDAGLENLHGLTALKELDLDDTKISDAGLKHLQGLSALTDLDLSGTKVTDAGVARLKQSLPNCNISH